MTSSTNLALVNTTSLSYQLLLFLFFYHKYCMTIFLPPPYKGHQPYSILEGEVRSTS